MYDMCMKECKDPIWIQVHVSQGTHSYRISRMNHIITICFLGSYFIQHGGEIAMRSFGMFVRSHIHKP